MRVAKSPRKLMGSVWTVVLVTFTLSACTTKVDPKTKGRQTTETSDAPSSPKNSSTPSKKAERGSDSTARRGGISSPKPVPKTPDLRTAFRAVLASGFKVRPKSKTKTTVEQCKTAYDSLLKHPDHLLSFVAQKLKDGRVFERPLAIKLAGQLGEKANQLSQYVADVVIRSWGIRFQRCLKKEIKWKKGLGQELDAPPDVRARCRKATMNTPPGVGVVLACEALSLIKNTSSIPRIIESGVAGRYMKPCLEYFLTAELTEPALLKMVAEEMHRPVNQTEVVESLARAQADGLRAALAVDAMRDASKKYVDDGSRCLLKAVVDRQSQLKILGLATKGLQPDDHTALEALGNLMSDQKEEIPVRARLCRQAAAQTIQNAMKAGVESVRLPSTTKKSPDRYAPFCPSDTH